MSVFTLETVSFSSVYVQKPDEYTYMLALGVCVCVCVRACVRLC